MLEPEEKTSTESDSFAQQIDSCLEEYKSMESIPRIKKRETYLDVFSVAGSKNPRSLISMFMESDSIA